MSTKYESQALAVTPDPQAKKLAQELAGVERASERREYKVRLELSTDPMNDSARWDAELHNESDGGIGVLSPHSAESDSLMFVRAYPPFEPHNWVCGNVVHCTPKDGSFVIGLRIHTPPNSFQQPDDSESFLKACKHFFRRIAGLE
jgi:hypothetical protein